MVSTNFSAPHLNLIAYPTLYLNRIKLEFHCTDDEIIKRTHYTSQIETIEAALKFTETARLILYATRIPNPVATLYVHIMFDNVASQTNRKNYPYSVAAWRTACAYMVSSGAVFPQSPESIEWAMRTLSLVSNRYRLKRSVCVNS